MAIRASTTCYWLAPRWPSAATRRSSWSTRRSAINLASEMQPSSIARSTPRRSSRRQQPPMPISGCSASRSIMGHQWCQTIGSTSIGPTSSGSTSGGLRQEIREHPEQVLRLSRDLGDAQEDAATLRSQRDGLQTRIRELEHQMHQVSSRRPEERAVAASRADLDALRGELRGEIRDLARAVKDAQSPLPRILAMTREVREAILAVQKTQGQNSGRLASLEQASQSLLMTADYLAAIAEETDADEEDDEEVFMDVGDDDEDAPADASVAEGVAPADGDVVEAAASTKTTTNRDDWQSEFDRVEDAWLAGRRVGDVHEELNFLHLLADLRMDALPRAQIVAAFDRFRARAGGERFSYCPLHGAVHIVLELKPSLA